MTRKTRTWTLVLILTLIAPASGLAQPPSPLSQPGLRQYVAEVLVRNAALAAAGTDVRAAEERIAPAGALPDPMLSFGLMSAPTPSFDLDQEPMTQLPIALQQMLPFPGKQGAAADVVRRETEVAGSRLGLEASTIATSAAAAFFDLAFARSALEVWRGRMELADQAVRVTMSRYETGRAPQAEMLRAQVRRARLAEEGHRFAAGVEAAAARADALRSGPGDSLRVPELVGPDSSAVLAALRDTVPDLDSLRGILDQRSPPLALADAEVERARASARVYEIAARPDLMLSLQYAPRVGRDPFFSAMIGFSVPLWAGRKQRPAAEAARLDLTGARSRQEDLHARLDAELRQRVARLHALRQQIEQLHAEVLPLAEVASESALRSYSVGAVDLTTVLDAQDDLFEARLDLARRIATHAAQRAALSALLGEEWYR